jgi:hypothetical protein
VRTADEIRQAYGRAPLNKSYEVRLGQVGDEKGLHFVWILSTVNIRATLTKSKVDKIHVLSFA